MVLLLAATTLLVFAAFVLVQSASARASPPSRRQIHYEDIPRPEWKQSWFAEVDANARSGPRHKDVHASAGGVAA